MQTLSAEMRPPLFFCLAKRKVAAAAVEKKNAFIQTCTCVQVWGNGFCENCYAGEELRTKSRAECGFHPALYAALIKSQTSG